MKLSNPNIDKVTKKAEDFFDSLNVSRKDTSKVCIILEETLLRFQEKFGEDHEFDFVTKKWFGNPKAVIRLKGTAYNPIEDDDNDGIFSQDIMHNLMYYDAGGGVSYGYRKGFNVISISPKKGQGFIKFSGGSITVAILLAIICSFAIKMLPLEIQNFIVNGLAAPVLETSMGLIVAVTIPTIFISVVSSICIMDDITALNDIGLRIIKRFFLMMLFIIVVSICVCEMFFPIISIEGTGNVFLEQIIELMLSIVPKNLFTPFIDGNILQIIVISSVIGAFIVILGNRATNIKTIIGEMKSLFFSITEWILKIIPLTIFLSIFKIMATTSFSEIFIVWKAVAANYIIFLIVDGVVLLHLKMKYKINIREFFKKNAPVFMVATTTGSGTASMMSNFDVCKKNLKIDPNLCDFWIPLSHTLFSPGAVLIMVICAFMGAVMSGSTISISQLFIMSFLSIQLSIVSPKVYGGHIAGFTILLNQFGFSTDAIGAMMIANVFTNNLGSLCGMILRNCEIFDLSHKIKLSDQK